MSYASLVSLEQTTDLFLHHHKYSICVEGREIVTSIREYVIFLISFLENFPEKAIRMEGKIRDLANEAEDLIEYFMLSQLQTDWSVEVSKKGRLNRVREKIGSITGDVMDDRLCDLHAVVSSSRVADTAKNDVVMGLDEDLIAIKVRLCGESSRLEVIPIVGMGGIGKTTLAQYAYNDPLIMEYFHIRVFVQVSQEYCVKEFLTNLLASINLSNISPKKEDDFLKKKPVYGDNESGILKLRVYQSLKGMRYLIVLDDIWSTHAWDDVRNIFPEDNNGSRIVLTTRLSDIATYASSDSALHQMKFMDGNHSWKLLKQKVFSNGGYCPRELEAMGKAIAEGCRGLPLAVVLVAGILSTITQTEASWEKIAQNVNSSVDGQLEKILYLSYKLLPHHLRPCFLFMTGYPEDHEIRVSRLIKLWIADGFLKHENGYKTLEEEAEEYLKDLVKRSLVLVTSRKSNGKIKSCSLHDLVRDMGIKKAQEEKFLLTNRYVLPNGRKDERRISIGHSQLHLIRSPTIRSILCFTTMLDGSSLTSLVSFKLLRVLEVLQYHEEVLLSPQVFELFHLRFLALPLTNIPAAISNLVNLQTLIILSKVGLKTYAPVFSSTLPLELWRMPQLRHLIFSRFYHTLPDTADGSTLSLQNLETLWGIANFVFSERNLKMIPNLKKLGIVYTDEKHYHLHNLVSLHQLEKLRIIASWSFSWPGQNPVFPRSLQKLSLIDGGFLWKDMSIVGSLPNLQVLKLTDHACSGDSWETIEGEFPQLKFLLIDNSDLKYWITENSHFPRLQRLVLHSCPYLRGIPDDIGEIPTLEMIEVDYEDVSVVNSAKQIQEDQQSYGNDALHVHVINQGNKYYKPRRAKR